MAELVSVITTDALQVDGRRAIEEWHGDPLGRSFEYYYLASSGADVQAILAAHAEQVMAYLAQLDAPTQEPA